MLQDLMDINGNAHESMVASVREHIADTYLSCIPGNNIRMFRKNFILILACLHSPTLFSDMLVVEQKKGWVEVILYLLASFPFSMLCIVSLILVKKGFAMLNKSCVEAEQEVFCHVIFQKELFGSSFICSCINVLRRKNSSQYSHT